MERMPALISFFTVVVAAVISLSSIVVNTYQSNFFPSPSPVVLTSPIPEHSPTPAPSPTPSPTPTPSPSPTPSPKPSVTPSPKPSPTSSTGSSSAVGNATVLTYNLSSTTIVTDTGNEDNCSNECVTKPLAQYIAENGGRAGMNGTYFCPSDYSSCAGKVNSFDFPVWNNRKKKWMNSDNLTWDGRGMMVFRPGSAQFHSCAKCTGAPSDITGGIVNHPSLLSGGNVLVGDGAKGTRSGIGYGGGKLFLVVARNASFLDLANTFKQLGATDALNLDGGGSVALYDGGYKVGPGRSLPNAVIVK